MKNGYVINNYDPTKLVFNAEDNSGSYVITLATADRIAGARTHTFRFNIGYKNSMSTISINVGSGISTQSAVNISYMPYLLHLMQGNVTITVYKDDIADYAIVQSVDVNNETVANLENNVNAVAKISVSEVGQYIAVARDSDGDVIWADSWTIEEGTSSIGTVVIIIVVVVVVVGAVMFLKLRTKMSVK
jgi:hypothetical protein